MLKLTPEEYRKGGCLKVRIQLETRGLLLFLCMIYRGNSIPFNGIILIVTSTCVFYKQAPIQKRRESTFKDPQKDREGTESESNLQSGFKH